MFLDSFLESRQSSLLVQFQKPPRAASSARVLISNEIDTAATEARGKPVIDTSVNRVQRAVRTVDGDSRSCTAQ
jgi:hypothetical protein